MYTDFRGESRASARVWYKRDDVQWLRNTKSAMGRTSYSVESPATMRGMDDLAIRRLNQINHDFYRVTAAEFDQTRTQPWPGWHKLLSYIERIAHRSSTVTVLDVGCGNGRFGVFLHDRLRMAQRNTPLHIR